MSNIKPFKGIRPTQDKVHLVAALPYDVMNSEEARERAEGNPYSFLHIDKAEIDLDPSVNLYDDAVYNKAAENLNKMLEDGIFIQDEKECFYIYTLTMNKREQTGLVCCCDIDEYLNGTIKKHEFTIKAKEADRIRHVDTCDANTGPIFLTYRAQRDICDIINRYKASHRPLYDFITTDGVTHTVWLVDKEDTVDSLKKLFAEVPALYIADGHHRTASAVEVGLKRRNEAKTVDPDAEYNYFLSVLFPDEELHIMDYNRVIKDLNGHSKEAFFNLIKENFDITEAPIAPFNPPFAHSFSMYIDNTWYSLIAKADIIDDSDPIMCLDVSILHKWLIEPILGITDVRSDSRIDFVGGIRGLCELENRVNSGEAKVAFALYPTTIEQVMNIADKGMVMPPKSTWFEPKLRSGIFIHKLS
ncbi:MAG: DUF1015 domain-containing protein [Clostridia bacterium]|nr:DUF1015 domain-containing protein [Clostridia bacterium]